MNEEIKIRVGMDSTAMGQSMRAIESKLGAWQGNIINSFKAFGASMLGAFTVGSAVNAVKTALKEAEDLTRQAQGLGISTGFLQDMKNIAGAAGIADEAITKMIQQMEKNMKPGESPEDAFWRLVESISAIEDPAERADAGIAAFGKSAFTLLELTAGGTVSLREMAAEFRKLTDDELEALNKLDAVFDKLENRMKVTTARAVAYAVEHWRDALATLVPSAVMGVPLDRSAITGGETIGSSDSRARAEIRASAERMAKIQAAADILAKEARSLEIAKMTNQQRHFALVVEHEQAIEKANRSRTEEDVLTSLAEAYKIEKQIFDLEKKMDEDRKKGLDTEKKVSEEKRKQREEEEKLFNAQRMRFQEAAAAAANQLASDAQFSIQDLASQQFNPQGRAAANRVMQLRQMSKMNMMTFNPRAMELGRNQLIQADKIVQQMSEQNPFLVNPMADLLQAANQQRDALTQLLQAASGGGGGIVVQAKD